MRASQRLAVSLVVAALASAACGARLTSGQRAEALSYGGGGGGAALGAGTTGGTGGTGTTGSTGSSSTGGTTGKLGGGTTGAVTPGSTGGGTTGGSTGAITATGPVANGDWTDPPAGGNGGATDVGITADSITVANISDISGAVPGLFEDARFATQAFFKYFNARYPKGIYGRHINVLALDSQLDSGQDRAATIQACSDSFAAVGGVSAFDQGGAPVLAGCKSAGGYYPTLSGLATTDEMKAVASVYPINAAGVGGTRSFGQFGWAAQMFPNAIKKAVYVYSDGEVTRTLAQQDEAGTSAALGYKWIDDIPIGTTETNYAPFAQQIMNDGAQYVTFVGAYQQAANLALALDQIGYMKQIAVYQPTVTAYTPDFISQAGSAAEYGNTFLGVSSGVNEEIASNPELQLYAQWVRQVNPQALPTDIGQFAWGAGELFVEKMIALGPHPTRAGLLALIPSVHDFTSNNLFPGQDVGGRRLGDCVVVVKVTNNAFRRYTPASGYRCIDGVYDTKTKTRMPGYPS